MLALVVAGRPSIVCIQESKLVVILDYDIAQCLGVGFDYAYLPVVHTRGYCGRLEGFDVVGFKHFHQALLSVCPNEAFL
jgi:hypothetical protein